MTDPETERSNPYVGLRPFFFEDGLYFFGRDRQTGDLLDLLRRNRFLGVVGSSGSGKSSLVRAGLLPMLLGGFLETKRDRWALAKIKPGDTPLINLAEGLLHAVGETPTPATIAALVEDIGDRHTEAVTEFLRDRVATSNILILVDQFEELFAFRNKAGEPGENEARERAARRSEASAYVDLMLRLAEYPDLPIYVVLTMRTDFLGDCDLFYGLPEALNIGRYLVPRLSRDELREAIECPATLVNASVAPRLLDQILNELGDRADRLPVVQHALVRTFDEWLRCGRNGPIDLDHYNAVGGLERALNNDADAALAGLNQRHAEAVFRRLTDTDLNQRRVRSPARISELMAVAGADRAAIDAVIAPFADKRRSFLYLSADGDRANPRVDIAHESLIRNWDKLIGWTDAENQARDIYIDLARRATRWAAGKGSSLEGPERRSAFAWVTATNPKRGWAQRYAVGENDYDTLFSFLNASQKSFYRWRGFTVALPVAIMLAGAGLVGVSETQQAAARQKAVNQAILQADAITTKMYSALEALGESSEARRDLLTWSQEFGKKLTDTPPDASVAEYWRYILAGDNLIDAYFEIAADDAQPGQYEGEMFKASEKYGLAADIARVRGYQPRGDIAWKARYALALAKLAPTMSDSADTCNVSKQAVAIDKQIYDRKDRAYDWTYQRFVGLNNLARITDGACLKPEENLAYFNEALKLGLSMRSAGPARLQAIAADLLQNSQETYIVSGLERGEEQPYLASATAQSAAAVQLLERAAKAKAKTTPELRLQLAEAKVEYIEILYDSGEEMKSRYLAQKTKQELEDFQKKYPEEAKKFDELISRLDYQLSL